MSIYMYIRGMMYIYFFYIYSIRFASFIESLSFLTEIDTYDKPFAIQ